MTFQAAVPACPVCGFTSIYTDGYAPCSVRCALTLAHKHHHECGVKLKSALRLVEQEAKDRGLPDEPDLRDIREDRYRYVIVDDPRVSQYWRLDRDLLNAGLNVEYLWLSRRKGMRGRVYRFAPSLLSALPESFLDLKVAALSMSTSYWLETHFPYWYFLSSR
jgi:hypothetical protein